MHRFDKSLSTITSNLSVPVAEGTPSPASPSNNAQHDFHYLGLAQPEKGREPVLVFEKYDLGHPGDKGDIVIETKEQFLERTTGTRVHDKDAMKYAAEGGNGSTLAERSTTMAAAKDFIAQKKHPTKLPKADDLVAQKTNCGSDSVKMGEYCLQKATPKPGGFSL
jgi:hypothetical protein